MLKRKTGERDFAKQRLQIVYNFLHCLGVRNSVKSGWGLFDPPEVAVVTQHLQCQ